MEQWRDVVGYEGLYQVSNLGKVRSMNWRNTGAVQELSLKQRRDGYKQVELFKQGLSRMIPVHQLVARAFVPGFKDGLCVNHLDENKGNNSAENLEWCTQAQNIRHSAHKFGLKSSTPPVLQLSMDGDVIRTWPNAVAIRKELGFNDWSIRCCCTGKRKQAYGFRWQFAI